MVLMAGSQASMIENKGMGIGFFILAISFIYSAIAMSFIHFI